ncbi:hypothetical protein BH11PSE3_BH11PSE3_06100 [soil metagenome]
MAKDSAAGGIANAKRSLGARAAGLAASVALVAGSVLFSLVALELGYRLLQSGPQALVEWPNLAHARLSTDGAGSCAYAYDATLGWTSPADCTSPQYNVDAAGFRITPATGALAEPPLLVVGSSFAKGDEVADSETWPAYLQALTGRRVVNAGVSGYALDQSVMTAERIAPKVKPLAILVGFTPNDIRRAELKVSWSREKPYFTATDGQLELHNVPVPGQANAPVALSTIARLLGRLMVADEIVKRLGLHKGWYYTETQGAPAGSGEAIACLLMSRLAALGVPTVVMAQYGRGFWRADAARQTRELRAVRKVLGCASEAGLVALDLADALKQAVEARGIDTLYRNDHHSAPGNRLMADLIVQALVERHVVIR